MDWTSLYVGATLASLLWWIGITVSSILRRWQGFKRLQQRTRSHSNHRAGLHAPQYLGWMDHCRLCSPPSSQATQSPSVQKPRSSSYVNLADVSGQSEPPER